jgi:hypothetical protein
LTRLLGFFRDRREYEAGPGPSFDRAKLIRFRDDRLEFGGPFFESLYHCWATRGEQAVQAKLASRSISARTLKGAFKACLLKHNYDLFGVITSAKATPQWADEA